MDEELLMMAVREAHDDDSSYAANLEIAKYYTAHSRFPQAEHHFQQAICYNTKDKGEVYFFRGNSFLKQGNMEAALKDYDHALRRDDSVAGFHHMKGAILHHYDDLKGAEQCYRKALELDPSYKQSFYNLGEIQFHKGELELAEALYLEALKVDPDFDLPKKRLEHIAEEKLDREEGGECLTRN